MSYVVRCQVPSCKVPQGRSTELHTRGIEQVQDNHKADHGVRDHEGIRIVDGWPHCAAMPLELADIEGPQRFKVAPLKKRATAEENLNFERNTMDLAKFDAKIAERRKYAFEFRIENPSDKDPSNTRWKCPAEVGKMKCARCPLSDAPKYDDKPVVENCGPADTAPSAVAKAPSAFQGRHSRNFVSASTGALPSGSSRICDATTLKASSATYATRAPRPPSVDSVA